MPKQSFDEEALFAREVESSLGGVLQKLCTQAVSQGGPRLFPGGVTSIKLNVKIEGVGSFELSIDGPQAAPGPAPAPDH